MTQILKTKTDLIEQMGTLLTSAYINDPHMAISLFGLNDLFAMASKIDAGDVIGSDKHLLGDPGTWWEVSDTTNNEILQKANDDPDESFEDGDLNHTARLLTDEDVHPINKAGQVRRFKGRDGTDYMAISYQPNWRLPNPVEVVLFRRIPKVSVFYHLTVSDIPHSGDQEYILFSGLENEAIEFADKMMQGFGKTVNEATEMELMSYQGANRLPSGARPYYACTPMFDILVAGE